MKRVEPYHSRPNTSNTCNSGCASPRLRKILMWLTLNA